MRIATIVLFVVILSSIVFVSAQAQVSGYIEEQFLTKDFVPQTNIWMRIPISGNLSFTTWTLINGVWAENYGGPSYAPTPWLEVSIAGGFEAVGGTCPFRYGSSVWMSLDNVSFLFLHEDGKSGPWHRAILNYDLGAISVVENIGVGIMSERFQGIGPRILLKNGKVSVWGTLFFDKDNGQTVMTCVNFAF